MNKFCRGNDIQNISYGICLVDKEHCNIDKMSQSLNLTSYYI